MYHPNRHPHRYCCSLQLLGTLTICVKLVRPLWILGKGLLNWQLHQSHYCLGLISKKIVSANLTVSYAF